MVNIEDLTLGQLREVSKLTGLNCSKSTTVASSCVGKYVIVRSRNEGINAGFVKAADKSGIILSEARRIWYHKPKDKKTSWYEGVTISGLSDDSKISAPVEEKGIIEGYSFTVCSDDAKKSISSHPTTETTC